MLCDDNTKNILKEMGSKHNAEVSGTAKCVPVTNDIKVSNLTDMDTSGMSAVIVRS